MTVTVSKSAYDNWIRSYEQEIGGPARTYAKCAEATQAMAERFPELMRVPGHVETSWGRRAHWWCKTPDGDIVDPTARQFPGGVFEYDEFKEGDPVRLGRCMNCGYEIWAPADKGVCNCICSPACGAELRADLGEQPLIPEKDPNTYVRGARDDGDHA